TGYSSRISGISPEISKCKELRMLTVGNNLVTDLPESLSELPNLTDIELYNLHMKQIPECITRMNTLVAVNFSRIKGLDYPKFMDSFERFCASGSKATLQILYMNENGLTTLPANLANLTNLGLLDLSANKIESLPMLGKEVALIQCLLNDNKIKHIPDNWFTTDDLEKLLADNNQLTTFPNLFSSKSKFQIEEVSLEGNQIASFTDQFRGVNIEVLNLNSNKLTSLPEEFSKTTSIVNFLRVSNNLIDTISDASIADFKTLKALEMKGNNLKYVTGAFNVETLPYLTGLDLSYNNFSRFPYSVLYCQLAELRISNQFDPATGKRSLKEWPDGVDKQPTLRVLDVHGNDMRSVLNFPVLLNYLDIHDNPNMSITVPEVILYRIMTGQFKFLFDENQDIKGI
ncbi:MAG: leucine-rich repeat domain-containing protein, partial [Bacteroidales bacterium]